MIDISEHTNLSPITASVDGFEQAAPDSAKIADPDHPLSEQEKQEVEQLKRRDAEVKAHEQAHRTTGGRHIRGSINYRYETGPDGKRYVTDGEVSIDTSEVKGNPRATIQKMQTVRKAAMAPSKPSAQDRAVAADAVKKEEKARQKMAEEKMAEKGNALSESKKPYSASSIHSYSFAGPTLKAVTIIPSPSIDVRG
jgi:hypothetical protein